MDSDAPSLGTPVGPKAQEYVYEEEEDDIEEQFDDNEFEADVKKEKQEGEPLNILKAPWISSDTGKTRTPKASRQQQQAPGAPVKRKRRRRGDSRERPLYVEDYDTETDQKYTSAAASASRRGSTAGSTSSDPITLDDRPGPSRPAERFNGDRYRTPVPPMRRRAAPPPVTPEERTLVIDEALSSIRPRDANTLKRLVPLWIDSNRHKVDAAVYQWRAVSKTGRTLFDAASTKAAYTKALVAIINSLTAYYSRVCRTAGIRKELQGVW